MSLFYSVCILLCDAALDIQLLQLLNLFTFVLINILQISRIKQNARPLQRLIIEKASYLRYVECMFIMIFRNFEHRMEYIALSLTMHIHHQ